MEKKYELGEAEFKQNEKGKRITVHRIRALRSFADVHEGDYGGFVSTEMNLSHDGNCWIYDDAMVTDVAIVSENAVVRHNARISGGARISGRAMIYEAALITGQSVVMDAAKVRGLSTITGTVMITDNAMIKDSSSLYDNVCVSGSAMVCGLACIKENANISGNAVVSSSVISGRAVITDNVFVEDNSNITGVVTVSGSVFLKHSVVFGPSSICIWGRRATIIDGNIQDNRQYLSVGPYYGIHGVFYITFYRAVKKSNKPFIQIGFNNGVKYGSLRKFKRRLKSGDCTPFNANEKKLVKALLKFADLYINK